MWPCWASCQPSTRQLITPALTPMYVSRHLASPSSVITASTLAILSAADTEGGRRMRAANSVDRGRVQGRGEGNSSEAARGTEERALLQQQRAVWPHCEATQELQLCLQPPLTQRFENGEVRKHHVLLCSRWEHSHGAGNRVKSVLKNRRQVGQHAMPWLHSVQHSAAALFHKDAAETSHPWVCACPHLHHICGDRLEAAPPGQAIHQHLALQGPARWQPPRQRIHQAALAAARGACACVGCRRVNRQGHEQVFMHDAAAGLNLCRAGAHPSLIRRCATSAPMMASRRPGGSTADRPSRIVRLVRCRRRPTGTE